MKIASWIIAKDPGRFMVDLGTDRGFLFAHEVWTKPEFRGRRAHLQREARDIYTLWRGTHR